MIGTLLLQDDSWSLSHHSNCKAVDFMAVWTTNNVLTPCTGENGPMGSPMKKRKRKRIQNLCLEVRKFGFLPDS